MTWDYIGTAHGLVRYFEGQTTAQGDWAARGQDAARAWVMVLGSPSVTTHDLRHVDELMLEGRREPGTGWQELLLAYDSWRESR